ARQRDAREGRWPEGGDEGDRSEQESDDQQRAAPGAGALAGLIGASRTGGTLIHLNSLQDLAPCSQDRVEDWRNGSTGRAWAQGRWCDDFGSPATCDSQVLGFAAPPHDGCAYSVRQVVRNPTLGSITRGATPGLPA